MEFEQEYQKLEKKYSLPPLKDMTSDFGVCISSEETLLHDILGCIIERIGEYAKTLESIVFVNTSSSVSELYEGNMVEDGTKLFDFYKNLMSFYWEARKVRINAEEVEMADFIKKTHRKWDKEMKPVLMALCKSLEKGWKEAQLRNSDINMTYHG